MKLDIIIKASEKGLKIPDDYKYVFNQIIEFCIKKRGGYMRLMLSPPFKHRSTGEKSQNHHLNGHCQQISNYSGEDFDIVKKHIKRIAIKYGYPTYTDIFGELQPKSETEIDTTECGYAIEASHEVAALLDIKLKE